MKDFFISYNKADKAWAEWIAWILEEAGYTTVLQAWDFRTGSNFVGEMNKATIEAERTMPVLSPDYLSAEFTQPEWFAAFARDPKGEKSNQDLGDLPGAKESLERALGIGEAVFGPDDPKVAIRLTRLGTVLMELGEIDAARAHLSRALEINRKVLGEDYPSTKIIRENLAALDEN
jgi:tetratricopeptide (TPR) repeat protein